MKRPAAKTERPRALETTHPPAVPCQAMRGWGALGGPVASQVAEAEGPMALVRARGLVLAWPLG